MAILVGPNGSGKSLFLRTLAEDKRNENVIAVSNTPHDRLAGMRSIRRISVGSTHHTPANVVKRAVARSLNEDSSSFYQISAIMGYCGYAPTFGFRAEKSENYGSSSEDLKEVLKNSPSRPRENVFWDTGVEYNEELHRALAFLKHHDPNEVVWIDANRSAFEFSLSRDFASVLRHETTLRRLNVIDRIEVMIQPNNSKRKVIEMHLASSGQLALISSLLFLITEAEQGAIILIDEPENSLHPNWQRDYVEKLMAAMSYKEATFIIATHAPLVVIGALGASRSKVQVFRLQADEPIRLEIDASASQTSIEAILWEAFAVVTPANHFVSEEIVRTISRFENGKVSKDEVLELVNELDMRSFDSKQKRFFEAIRKLVDKVEKVKVGLAVIAAALDTQKPWNWQPGSDEQATLLTAAKIKIRNIHLERHGNKFCYCRFPLNGGGHFIIDPEHILPKSVGAYRALSYTVWNLGVSCKHCNMQYKRAKTDFLIETDTAAAFQQSKNYRLIHPNFDPYKEHISYCLQIDDDTTLIKYTKHPGSEKGLYTYDYFNLSEREVETFDKAQGIDIPDNLGTGALEAQDLVREFGQ